MPTRNCKKCNAEIPISIIIDGKRRILTNRVFCFDCSPFGRHNTRDITQPRRKRNPHSAAVQRCQRRKKQKAVEYFGGACCLCGYDRCAGALTFHHVDPDTKTFAPSYVILRRAWAATKKELQKCILVCSNCHGEIHAGMYDDATLRTHLQQP